MELFNVTIFELIYLTAFFWCANRNNRQSTIRDDVFHIPGSLDCIESGADSNAGSEEEDIIMHDRSVNVSVIEEAVSVCCSLFLLP